jgi:hypothetical protein
VCKDPIARDAVSGQIGLSKLWSDEDSEQEGNLQTR